MTKVATLTQPPPVAALRSKADALFRSATECCRQRVRHARLVRHEASEAEQRVARKAAGLYDDLLEEVTRAYEKLATQHGASPDDEWRHRADMLLHASREYLRHRERCDRAPRQLGAHSPAELEGLTVGYELCASALLALRQAADDYRKVAPEAELKGEVLAPTP